jgi:hypothetical protein
MRILHQVFWLPRLRTLILELLLSPDPTRVRPPAQAMFPVMIPLPLETLHFPSQHLRLMPLPQRLFPDPVGTLLPFSKIL